MDLFKKCYDYKLVDELKEAQLYPYFHSATTGQDTEMVMEGHKIIMIGSNNYLGLTSDPRVIEAGVEAIKKYGSGNSGSRFLNGTLDVHIKLEEELAEFLHKEACITMSTGFQANLGIISAIAGRNDVILCDKENHASIYDGIRLSYAKMIRYEHNDMADLEEKLKMVPEDKGILIITDSVFSMTGEICNLPKLVELKKKYGARLMLDEAHGIGVLGANGRGAGEHFDLEDEVDIIMGTFSKSFASLGGFMAAKKEVINYVQHTSRPFIFSASITPASVECARKSLAIIKEEPQRVTRLRDISAYMREKLKSYGVKIIEAETPIIPIFVYEDEKAFLACKMLLERGVYVNPVISPATPPGQALLRTSYMATHSEEQMDYAAKQIAEVLKELECL
ncbi:MAG: aminotransferase class I/II-fold pyridoxal phosphate-dependent enzyme [Clostridia bacterium]|nr:aminotransferase class I/II-fold pyridoxal phosphate-dependent enzyme [Clostridia bacterium]